MLKFPIRVTLAALLIFAISAGQSRAQSLEAAMNALGEGGFAEREAAVNLLASTADPKAVAALEALSRGDLYVRKSDKKVFLGKDLGAALHLTDPVSAAGAGEAPKGEFEKIRVNNALRRSIDAVLGSLTLLNADPAIRRAAAQSMFKSADPARLEALEAAIARETDAAVKAQMQEARAAAIVKSARPPADKRAAVETLSQRGGQDALALLQSLQNAPEAELAGAAKTAAARIENEIALWNGVQNIWYGVSLGSVLLLAAIGLAITFGVMGVINMAHGEMVMIGAYTTFVVQEVFRAYAPGYFDYSLFIAIPAAFLIAGAIGVAMERGVIRFLYGRPLETLLATWGLSLILQQAVRSIFGPSNQQVGTPSWMSGTIEVAGGLSLTANRIAIVAFAAMAFIALLLLIRKTAFGLQMRAVTQNRGMANSMGIRSNWVDAATFGLGSAIAGIAGVALSQIDNVSPNLGQSYIIDSFLVVVFGGVGNLWGTLVGAMSLGILNKFLEPYAGAVLGKILILIGVILFIQSRPRGLFPLKGRAVEA